MNTRTKKTVRDRLSMALAGLALATAAASCATTDMTSTWTDPSAKGAALSKVAVLCMTKDAGLRRIAEDTAASHLTGAQAIPSYQILGDADLRDREGVKAKLRAAGVNGVLVMRLTGVNEQVTPVDPYATFDGYYDFAGAGVFAPGYLQTDTIVHMVSNLYDLNQNKLIWSGTSQTFDPASAKQFMGDVSKAVAKSLEKDRLIL
ncbi:MAG TPA: hypothetical protein VHO67_22580 [Polyangia bacterium]|nr:hypothetical protein [Polyangia bacterium]